MHGPIWNPDTETDPLVVTSAGLFSCSTEVTAIDHSEGLFIVEVDFGGGADSRSTLVRPENLVYHVQCTESRPHHAYGQVNSILNCVVRLCEVCRQNFYYYHRITFGTSLKLNAVCGDTRYGQWFQSVTVPDSVVELCDRCFGGCRGLHRVTFDIASKLQCIGRSAFSCTKIEFVAIPDSVVELCEHCFLGCRRLRRVTFGPSPHLNHIGVKVFAGTNVDTRAFPRPLRKLCRNEKRRRCTVA